MNHRLYVALAIVTILATSWYACGGSGSSSNSSPTSPSGSTTSATMFEGTIAGSGGQIGAFSVTIQTALAASSLASIRAAGLRIKQEDSFTQVSGTLNVAGAAGVALGGSYDSSTNNVSLSGGGFTLTGTISGAVLSGAYTGPSSSGEFSALNSTQTSVTAYCGTFSDGGTFTMQVSANGTVSGVAGPSTGQAGDTFAGQLNGINLSFSDPSGNTTGTGIIQNGIVNGTLGGAHGAGTFTGSTGVCSVPTPPPAASGVAFNIAFAAGPGSFAASLQNDTLTASGAYHFILPPGVYTISGQVLGVGGPISGVTQGGLTIGFSSTNGANCNSGPCAGVAPAVQSSITGGVGGNANQSVSSCAVAYNTGNPNNCVPPSGGAPARASARPLPWTFNCNSP